MALRSNDLTIFEIAAGTGMLSCAVELACAAVGERARTIGYCERDACAAACLVARMEAKTLYPAPVWDNAWTLDCEPWRGQVDCLCAGYPCQPFSAAGKRLGHRDPRNLWPAVRRAIARIEPDIVFLENVAGHVTKGAGKVFRDLQRLGYRATAGLFSSDEVGANHQRKRVFVLAVADAEGDNDDCRTNMGDANGDGQHPRAGEARPKRRKATRARCDGLPRYAPARNDLDAWTAVAEMDPARMPAVESALCRVANGLASRTDQLRLAGNGVDPLATAYAFLSLWTCLRG